MMNNNEKNALAVVSGLTEEELMDRIHAMRKQEETGYSYQDYLLQQQASSSSGDEASSSSETITTTTPSVVLGVDHHGGGEGVNVVWREKICQWSYNVVDHFDLSREIVSISLHIFDRYLATLGNECTGNLVLLTSLTTLYIAVKLHATERIHITTLIGLSRGQFDCIDIEDMEWNIIFALQFRLHIPTQHTFVSHMLYLLSNIHYHIEQQQQQQQQENDDKFLNTNSTSTGSSSMLSSSTNRELFELSRYQTELAICDSYFISIRNSVIAYAAILNVMDDMNHIRLPATTRQRFIHVMADKFHLHHNTHDVLSARRRLRSMFSDASTTTNVASWSASTPLSSFDVDDEEEVVVPAGAADFKDTSKSTEKQQVGSCTLKDSSGAQQQRPDEADKVKYKEDYEDLDYSDHNKDYFTHDDSLHRMQQQQQQQQQHHHEYYCLSETCSMTGSLSASSRSSSSSSTSSSSSYRIEGHRINDDAHPTHFASAASSSNDAFGYDPFAFGAGVDNVDDGTTATITASVFAFGAGGGFDVDVDDETAAAAVTTTTNTSTTAPPASTTSSSLSLLGYNNNKNEDKHHMNDAPPVPPSAANCCLFSYESNQNNAGNENDDEEEEEEEEDDVNDDEGFLRWHCSDEDGQQHHHRHRRRDSRLTTRHCRRRRHDDPHDPYHHGHHCYDYQRLLPNISPLRGIKTLVTKATTTTTVGTKGSTTTSPLGMGGITTTTTSTDTA